MDGAGDLRRFAPGDSAVGALGDPHLALMDALRDALFLRGIFVGAVVKQQDLARGPIDDRTRIADGVRSVAANDLRSGPGLSPVRASLEDDGDLSEVAVFPAFAEGQQRPLPGDRQSRDTDGRIAVGAAAAEKDPLIQRADLQCAGHADRHRQNQTQNRRETSRTVA